MLQAHGYSICWRMFRCGVLSNSYHKQKVQCMISSPAELILERTFFNGNKYGNLISKHQCILWINLFVRFLHLVDHSTSITLYKMIPNWNVRLYCLLEVQSVLFSVEAFLARKRI